MSTKLYNKDSSSMLEVQDESVQLCITGLPGPVGRITVRDTCSSDQVRRYAIQKYHNISQFLFGQVDVHKIYGKQLIEIRRVLKPDGVLILQMGNAIFHCDKDLFQTEMSVLYPYMMAEDFVLTSPLRLRFDIPSVVHYPNERRIEHWFVFSKTEKYKHKKIPLIMYGTAGITKIENDDFRTAPEQILRKLVACFSSRDDLLLDPYAGLGTLAKVAEKMGRKTVLYEFSPRTFALLKRKFQEFKATIT